MLKSFYPQYMYKSVTDIEENFFKKHNIKNVVLDIDNTLVPYTQAKPSKSALEFINRLKSEGIRVCLVSNNKKSRVEEFNEELNLEARYRAAKPLTGRLRSAMQSISAKPAETAIIGDQIFTDVYCGNRMKILTILVEPIENKESRFFKIKRHLEKKIIHKMEREKRS